jgi:hypothetical protein
MRDDGAEGVDTLRGSCQFIDTLASGERKGGAPMFSMSSNDKLAISAFVRR